jgi:hypothetical protein
MALRATSDLVKLGVLDGLVLKLSLSCEPASGKRT